MMKSTSNRLTKLVSGAGNCGPLKIAAIFIGLSAFFTADLMAQSGGQAGAYTRMGFGARGMGMGNAMSSVYQQGIYSHYNPALAAKISDTQVDLSLAAMSFDRSLNAANIAFQLPPSAGISIGILHAGVSDFDGRSVSGVPTDKFSINEFNVFTSFGLRISPKFNIGLSAKLFYADFFDGARNPLSFGIDLGTLYTVNDRLTFAATIQDILSSYSWDTSDVYGTSGSTRTDHFPTRFKFGASYLLPDYDVLISAEYEIRSERAQYVRSEINTDFGGPGVITTTEDITTGTSLFRIGAAYEIHERLTLRGGWQVNDLELIEDTHQPSAGFSLHLPFDRFSPSIDYTFIREPEGIAFMHVFAIRLNL